MCFVDSDLSFISKLHFFRVSADDTRMVQKKIRERLTEIVRSKEVYVATLIHILDLADGDLSLNQENGQRQLSNTFQPPQSSHTEGSISLVFSLRIGVLRPIL